MKKISILFVSVCILSVNAIGQTGFILDRNNNGPLSEIDLSNAQKTFVGNTNNEFLAGDIGPNGVFYGISLVSYDYEFYEIDTITGSVTFISTIDLPAGDGWWSGMAYDESTGIMYGYAKYSVWGGSQQGSLYTIDVSNGVYTLIGTQYGVGYINCIAIDGTGQMYGMNQAYDGEFYTIDKTDGSIAFLGNLGVYTVAGASGLDYCDANQTMYLVSTDLNEHYLYTIDLSNGSATLVGDILEPSDVIAFVGSSGVGILENNFRNNLLLYPNPTDGDFSVDLGEQYQMVTITVNNIEGKIVQSEVYSNSQILGLKLEVSSGIYLVNIEAGDKKAVIRLVKE